MRILAVDDKAMPLRALESAISQAQPDAQITACQNAEEALEIMRTAPCEVAFIDIQMPGMNGIELAKNLKLIHPRLNIIFATGYDEYMDTAFKMHASGYLMKPITAEAVADELRDLRHPVSVPSAKERLFIKCFGNFEVFIDGVPVRFLYDKTKEILAYLVDRHTMCTNGEIMAALWQDEISGSYFRTLKKDLMDTLKAHGLENTILRQRGKMGVDMRKLTCDYYLWLDGEPAGLNAYRGEYMSQYSWAEFTYFDMK